jgi:hypothetical protein
MMTPFHAVMLIPMACALFWVFLGWQRQPKDISQVVGGTAAFILLSTLYATTWGLT